MTIEDLVGSIEVIVFPKDFEKYHSILSEDAKLFVYGRVNAEDDKNAKLILTGAVTFDDATPENVKGANYAPVRMSTKILSDKEVWLKFEDKEEYDAKIDEIFRMLRDSDGNDQVGIFLAKEKAMKKLPPSKTIRYDETTEKLLKDFLGEDRVRLKRKDVSV